MNDAHQIYILYLLNGNCSKILNTFLFLISNEMFAIRAGIHKMHVRTAKRGDPDQTASSESVAMVQWTFPNQKEESISIQRVKSM